MDKEYRQLLDIARDKFDSFSLVWRDQLAFNENSVKFEKALEQFLIKEQYTNEWPGTKLAGSKAEVRTCKVTADSLNLLSQINNVFEFRSPNYPEDIAFYSNGKIKFASIAHEVDSWFEET